MPVGADTEPLLVDTSVAVPLALRDHDDHEATVAAIGPAPLGLSGHAAFETLSVLTRLPPPLRSSTAAVRRFFVATFPETRHLSPDGAAALLDELAGSDIAGGSVYDALVGACAREHGLRLVTRDRRAVEIYRQLDVAVLLLP
jgi:predicted nucleic acid-binding protein